MIGLHYTLELSPQPSCLCLLSAGIVGLQHLADHLCFLINTKVMLTTSVFLSTQRHQMSLITKSVTVLPAHTVAGTLNLLIPQLRVLCHWLITSSCNGLTSWLTIVLQLYLHKFPLSQNSPIALDIDRCY